MERLFFILSFALLLTACRWVDGLRPSSEDQLLVAEVAGVRLTRPDLDMITATANSPEDSARIAEAYIAQWASDALLYDRAKRASTPAMAEQVEQYRRQLYIYEYEKALVNARMSKDIAPDSIRAYYEAHPQLFSLRENIVCGALLIIPNAAPEQTKLKRWLAGIAKEGDDLEKVEKYAYHYASGYELFLSTWKTENQLLLRLPIESSQLASRLHSTSLIELQDSVNTYLLQVTDRRFIGDQMPLSYASTEIEKILLGERQAQFLLQQKQQLYNDALKKNRIKRYDKE